MAGGRTISSTQCTPCRPPGGGARSTVRSRSSGKALSPTHDAPRSSAGLRGRHFRFRFSVEQMNAQLPVGPAQLCLSAGLLQISRIDRTKQLTIEFTAVAVQIFSDDVSHGWRLAAFAK